MFQVSVFFRIAISAISRSHSAGICCCDLQSDDSGVSGLDIEYSILKSNLIMISKPGKVKINKVKDRILYLSPSVKLGHENEANLRDFDIGDMLGSGAFGQVYKVTHKSSKRVFALKVIEKAKLKKNKMENQIQNEVKIMYSLDNENIVRLFNHFEDDENVYLVMEFAEEGQLMNKLKKEPAKKLREPVAAAYKEI